MFTIHLKKVLSLPAVNYTNYPITRNYYKMRRTITFVLCVLLACNTFHTYAQIYNADSLSYSIDFPQTPHIEIEDSEIGQIITAETKKPLPITSSDEGITIIPLDSVIKMTNGEVFSADNRVVIWADSISNYIVTDVAYNEYAAEIIKGWTALKDGAVNADIVQLILTQLNGELISQAAVQAGDVVGVSLYLKREVSSEVVICRAFLTERHLYLVMAVGGCRVTPETPAVVRFMDSFRIK
jgi:hypothetical protein